MDNPSTAMMAFSAMGAVSSGASGFAQSKQGQAQAAAYDYNANVVMQETGEKVQSQQAKYSALVGKQRSLYAASGVDISKGSPLLISIDTAMKGAEETSRIWDSGVQQSNLLRYYGDMAKFSGNMAGLTTFLTGMGKSSMGLMMQQKGMDGTTVNPTPGPFNYFALPGM